MSKAKAVAKNEKGDSTTIYRINPPIVPMGFKFGIMGDEMCIIDFLDEKDENNIIKVSRSVAFTKKHARDVVEGLNKFINDKI